MKPVDPMVYDLARHFAKDIESENKAEITQELAEEIQGLIEDFINDLTGAEEEE